MCQISIPTHLSSVTHQKVKKIWLSFNSNQTRFNPFKSVLTWLKSKLFHKYLLLIALTPHQRDALFLQPGPAFFQVNCLTKLAFFNSGSFGLENVVKELLMCLNWHLKLTPQQ